MWFPSVDLSLYFIAMVTSAAGKVSVLGYAGSTVHIRCPYEHGYEDYDKYLCTSGCGGSDIVGQTWKGVVKFALRDNKTKRLFTVTMPSATAENAGQYWCGVSRFFKDIYTEVTLEVLEDRCCDEASVVQGSEGGSVAINCSYQPKDGEKTKLLCRATRPSECLPHAIVSSSSQSSIPHPRPDPDPRFQLQDNKRAGVFTVAVGALTTKDSGTYLCGFHGDRGLEVRSIVTLEVKAPPPLSAPAPPPLSTPAPPQPVLLTPPPSTPAPTPPVSQVPTATLTYIAIAAVCVSLLAGTVTAWRRRRGATRDSSSPVRKTSAGEEKTEDIYENQDVLTPTKMVSPENGVEDHQDSIYQNFSTEEEEEDDDYENCTNVGQQ